MSAFLNTKIYSQEKAQENWTHIKYFTLENIQNNMKKLKGNMFLISMNVNKHILKFS